MLQSRSFLYSYVGWKFAAELRAGSASTPGLPLLQPPRVTLVKSLNLPMKEDSVELSRRRLLIAGGGCSGADGC